MSRSRLRVEVAHDLCGIVNRPDWEQLAGAAVEKLPTLLAGFLVPWFQHAAPDYRCHALTAWQDDRLVGFAPFAFREVGRFGMSHRILGFPMRGTTPPFDLLFSGQDDEVAAAFVDHLERSDGWDMVFLHNVRLPSGPTDALCRSAQNAGFDVDRTSCTETLYVETDTSWDEFLRKRHRNIRKNIWRGWRNCEKIGVTKCLTYPGDIDDLDRALDYAFQLLRTSWKKIEGAKSLDDHFLGLVARALDDDKRLTLRFLTINQTPVSYLMEIHCRDDWYLFHSAFDPAYRQLSVGQLIIGDCIRAAHYEGVATVDLLGSNDYLARWTDKCHAVDEIVIIKPSRLSRLKSRFYQRARQSRRAAAVATTAKRKDMHKSARKD